MNKDLDPSMVVKYEQGARPLTPRASAARVAEPAVDAALPKRPRRAPLVLDMLSL